MLRSKFAMDALKNSKDSVPLITIGLTCFNAEDTIGQALKSAQQQTWSNLEILVVDDGSSDGSVGYVRRIAEQDPRIRLVCHEGNKGTAVSRNSILHNAQGEFIVFFDDDDTSVPDRIEKQWQWLKECIRKYNTDLVFCYCNRNVIKAGADEVTGTYKAIGRKEPGPHGSTVSDFILWHYEDSKYAWGHLGSCTLMFRKSVVEQVGDFDERFRRCAEWDWAIRAAFLDSYFIAVDQPLVIQRITPTSDKMGAKPLKYALMLRKKYKEYLKKQRVYLASLAMAYSRFHYAQGRRWLSRLYLVLASLCSPCLVLPNELAKRRRYKNTQKA
jgi:glycosyltransferase involved in cell wall biosynthesis